MNTSPLEHPCPQCKKIVVWDEEAHFRPFCSERCKLIDLGEWADESYRIPVSQNSFDGEDY